MLGYRYVKEVNINVSYINMEVKIRKICVFVTATHASLIDEITINI